MYDICFSLSDWVHSYTETVQSPSCVQLFATPWTAAGFPVLHHLQEFAQTHVHWVSTAVQPLSPSSLPSTFPNIRVFSNELALHIRWLKYWSFGFSISPSSGIFRVYSYLRSNSNIHIWLFLSLYRYRCMGVTCECGGLMGRNITVLCEKERLQTE